MAKKTKTHLVGKHTDSALTAAVATVKLCEARIRALSFAMEGLTREWRHDSAERPERTVSRPKGGTKRGTAPGSGSRKTVPVSLCE